MSLRVIAAWLKFFQKKPSWCRNEQVCQGRKSVKRFVRYNGLNTAAYKNVPLSPLSMERVLERFRRRLCLRMFRAEHALLLEKNASTMNITHVSMAQIAAPINVRADKVCYPTR